MEIEHILPKFELYVDESLAFTLRIFGWLIQFTINITAL